jgi:hypothetical protein
MSKASGIVLIAAGLAVAAYVLPSGDLTEADLARVGEVTKAPVDDNTTRVVIVPPEPKPALRPQQAAAEPVPAFSAPVIVTIAQRPNEPAKAAPVPRDREAIGRELQKELRRVGCYDGELNGAWTTSTKQAMKLFMDRVNASLPTEEPDSILLTMVRGYQDRVCGKPCPAGQGLGGDGRCVPNAILVRAAPKPPVPVVAAAPVPAPAPVAAAAPKPVPAITGWTTTTTASAPPAVTPPTGAPPPEGRMALAGPQSPTDPAATPPTEQPPQAAAPTPPAPAKRPATLPIGSGEGNWARSVFRNNTWN